MSIWRRICLRGGVGDMLSLARAGRGPALVLGCCLAMLLASPSAQAERGHGRGGAHAATAADDTLAQWRELTPAQREVLAPLARQWGQMDDTAREKWLNVADRYKRLSPAEQGRVRERMEKWSNLPPQARGEARLRFQQSRQLSPEERQRKWEAYQSLPPETREALSRRAQRQAKPVELPRDMTGPREARQVYATQQRRDPGQSNRKSNVVPRTPDGARPGPMVVAPAVIKAGPGATTRLLTQPPSPPAHQQAGLPKINSAGPFVDPVTLLPRKGAQGAAITPPPPRGEPKR
ncbi:MAG: DUF3106 domain-containing protein [Aquabacterium sp.]|uniref:DUF3106 domain-containing protein n=1 Tax=Aquabacterium sp. TaxID=1872578 RepID=UPI002A3658A8|nr:DUF3106 domain-containing protein [Aquabacterium sp.]MDX9843424.1 DUF3106 domain-containing protein [Aquabacterium sp.]